MSQWRKKKEDLSEYWRAASVSENWNGSAILSFSPQLVQIAAIYIKFTDYLTNKVQTLLCKTKRLKS